MEAVNPITRIVEPGVLRQVQSIGLNTIQCECGGLVYCAGMDISSGTVRISCLSCGITSCEFLPIKRGRDGEDPEEQKPKVVN